MGRGVDDKNIISKASAKKHEREMRMTNFRNKDPKSRCWNPTAELSQSTSAL